MAENSPCCSDQEKKGSSKNRPSNLPKWGFLLLLTLIIAVSAACVIIWVKIFPRPFDVDVKDMTGSYYNTSHGKYRAMFNFTLGFNNPNGMLHIYYKWLNVTIEGDNTTLASINHGVFVQPPKNVTLLPLSMSSPNGNALGDKTLWDLEPTSMEDIRVDIQILAYIMLYTKYWKSKTHPVGILCSNVRVHPPNNASASKPTTCIMNL